MPEPLQQIIPIPSPQVSEIFQVYLPTQAFYDEVRIRQAHEDYCDWYDRVAAQHQQELEAMQDDWNLLGWFCRD